MTSSMQYDSMTFLLSDYISLDDVPKIPGKLPYYTHQCYRSVYNHLLSSLEDAR